MWSGRELVRQLLPKVGQKYVFGTLVPKVSGQDWNGPWDCAEFVAWGLVQVGVANYLGCRGKNHDAYTGYFYDDLHGNWGLPITEEEAELTMGALCLRAPEEMGVKVGHIAVSRGNGLAIEAHSTKQGVTKVHSVKGRFKHFYKIACFVYEPAGTAM